MKILKLNFFLERSGHVVTVEVGEAKRGGEGVVAEEREGTLMRNMTTWPLIEGKRLLNPEFVKTVVLITESTKINIQINIPTFLKASTTADT